MPSGKGTLVKRQGKSGDWEPRLEKTKRVVGRGGKRGSGRAPSGANKAPVPIGGRRKEGVWEMCHGKREAGKLKLENSKRNVGVTAVTSSVAELKRGYSWCARYRLVKL